MRLPLILFPLFRIHTGSIPRRRIRQLPAAAEGFVELDDGGELVAAGLGERDLGGKKKLLGLQQFEIAGVARGVPLLGIFDRILIGADGAFLLTSRFGQFLTLRQGVGDLGERIERGLLIPELRFFPRGFCLGILTAKSAALKERTGHLRTGRPETGFARREVFQLWAHRAENRAQADARQKTSLGHADAGVGGAGGAFRLTDVGPAFEQFRGQAGGNFRRQRLFGQPRAASDRTGVAAEQDAELILLGRDQAFEGGHPRGARGRRGFGAGGFKSRGNPACEPFIEKFQAVVERLGGAMGDRQFLIKLQQFEVSRGHLAHEAEQNSAPVFFSREILGAGRLVEPADAAPEVEFPRDAEIAVETAGRCARALRIGVAELGVAAAVGIGYIAGTGKTLSVNLGGNGVKLFDPRGGNAGVKSFGQCHANQFLQPVVAINLPPRQIGQRMVAGRRLAPKREGRLHGWPLVVRTDGAAGEPQKGKHCTRCWQKFHGSRQMPPDLSGLSPAMLVPGSTVGWSGEACELWGRPLVTHISIT